MYFGSHKLFSSIDEKLLILTHKGASTLYQYLV
jgi:hypothetical protein